MISSYKSVWILWGQSLTLLRQAVRLLQTLWDNVVKRGVTFLLQTDALVVPRRAPRGESLSQLHNVSVIWTSFWTKSTSSYTRKQAKMVVMTTFLMLLISRECNFRLFRMKAIELISRSWITFEQITELTKLGD